MLKYAGTDIVFQEFPDEVTLAVNITGCPNNCPGCHSAYLKEDTGSVLDEVALLSLIANYRGEITCIGLMGGDADPQTVMLLMDTIILSIIILGIILSLREHLEMRIQLTLLVLVLEEMTLSFLL